MIRAAEHASAALFLSGNAGEQRENEDAGKEAVYFRSRMFSGKRIADMVKWWYKL